MKVLLEYLMQLDIKQRKDIGSSFHSFLQVKGLITTLTEKIKSLKRKINFDTAANF